MSTRRALVYSKSKELCVCVCVAERKGKDQKMRNSCCRKAILLNKHACGTLLYVQHSHNMADCMQQTPTSSAEFKKKSIKIC